MIINRSVGAHGGTRTLTPLRETAFKAVVSANFTTCARLLAKFYYSHLYSHLFKINLANHSNKSTYTVSAGDFKSVSATSSILAQSRNTPQITENTNHGILPTSHNRAPNGLEPHPQQPSIQPSPCTECGNVYLHAVGCGELEPLPRFDRGGREERMETIYLINPWEPEAEALEVRVRAELVDREEWPDA